MSLLAKWNNFGGWRGAAGRGFLRSKWEQAGIGCIIGALAATVVQMVTRDCSFAPFIHKKALALGAATHISGFRAYRPELIALLAGLFAIGAIPIVVWMRRYLRAWWAGITSITIPLVVSTSFVALTYWHRLSILVGLSLLLVACTVVEYWRQCQDVPISIEPKLAIPTRKIGLAAQERWNAPISDDPIRNWDDDLVGRASVVELLADHALHLRAPVVALHGDLGDGKSSVLNLLRTALDDQAIVVSFSAWLPGSEATLASDLFRDLTNECRKYVFVPQLRKLARAYAQTIGGSVKYLAGLGALFPAETQREEIRKLRQTLSRVPLPIIVLVDEIDRMQEEELRVLLKILRGASTIPNVTFVCAFSEEHVKDTLGEKSPEYLEKFFPVSIRLSPPDPDVVGACFRTRLRKGLENQQWFKSKKEGNEFTEALELVWKDTISKICTNFRKAGLLVNSILTTARPIAGEVNALDLTLIETVRRYQPVLYRLIRTKGAVLTYGSASWTKGGFLTREDREKQADAFSADLNRAIGNECPEPDAVARALSCMFPAYSPADRENRFFYASVRATDENVAEDEKRICNSDYFQIYFRDAVPEEMFSNAELGQTLSDLRDAPEAEVEAIFNRTLDSIPPRHPKREDFLWKLSRQVNQINDKVAENLAYSVARRAADYSYDILNVGEAARALGIVFAVAEKLSSTRATQRVLEGAMSDATDDTFAIRLLGFTERKESNKIITDFSKVDARGLENCFIQRMRSRYGPERDIQAVNITRGDWHAFVRWAKHSNEDLELEHNFWRRFIGKSRRRLGQAVNFAFPANVAWSEDPVESVDVIFPTTEFAALISELPEVEPLDEKESEGIRRMQQLLAGEYRGPFNL